MAQRYRYVSPYGPGDTWVHIPGRVIHTQIYIYTWIYMIPPMLYTLSIYIGTHIIGYIVEHILGYVVAPSPTPMV